MRLYRYFSVLVILGCMAMNTTTVATAAEKLPLIYLNQSGFNLNKPKRFTAPTLADKTPFAVINKRTSQTVFKGLINGNIGDLTAFNPISKDEFYIKSADQLSHPFRIGHYWLERVTYQGAVDFMIQSRHYVGNYKKRCVGSFAWRDDHHFGWELNTLVPQYLSNPSAYERMPRKIKYRKAPVIGGTLEPYKETAPDIVKMIHFGADAIITQKLGHELLKEQLAFFLYAWPHIKQWLPQQNYHAVSKYAFACWENETISRKYPYDKSKGHNILALKTAVGTIKGELPPGHTILPNLLIHEAAKRQGRSDAKKYFDAAFRQTEWIVKNLDWNDPTTTKGQRMSEHVTMTALAMMLKTYPNRCPKGLAEKIEEWKKIMVARSENMWDFRKYSADQWTGPKNEPGNVIGFPACALAAVSATPNSKLNDRMRQLAWSHMDSAFGRNPTGRHFSYDASREIEGVELGWYTFFPGGIGKLEKVPFVFDGAPLSHQYPYKPDAKPGRTEGWVQFNVAYNLSLAYMAYDNVAFEISRQGKAMRIRLKAPLNFNYDKVETATISVSRGKSIQRIVLKEEDDNSAWFAGVIDNADDVTEISYGYGYFRRKVNLPAGPATPASAD